MPDRRGINYQLKLNMISVGTRLQEEVGGEIIFPEGFTARELIRYT
jgi:hypothetical protein